MRFDLEINIIDTLEQSDIDKLSSNLYSEDTEIIPLKWDTIQSNYIDNSYALDINFFKNLKDIPNNLFSSGLTEDSLISPIQLIQNNRAINIIFNGGDFYSFRDRFSWSNNTIYDKVCFCVNGTYSYNLPHDILIDSIQVFTLKLEYPGFYVKAKSFIYVEYDNISLETTFKKNKNEFLFTIKDNIIYLNKSKILYSNKYIGKITDKLENIFSLPEFPTLNLSIEGFSSNDYIEKSGAILIKKDVSPKLEKGEDITVSFEVTPIISYKTSRSENMEDIVFENSNISSKALNFKNGTLCLYQSFNNEIIPKGINLKVNKENIKYTDSVNVKSYIYGLDNIVASGIPMENKDITIDILTKNATWQDSGEYTLTSRTSIDGSISATLIPDSVMSGIYIQKEWIYNKVTNGISQGIIELPTLLAPKYIKEKLSEMLLNGNVTDVLKWLRDNQNEMISNIRLYLILDQDPILGKQFASTYEEGIKEFFTSNKLTSYIMNGKKVAYVEIKDIDGKIYTRFIRPSNIGYNLNKSKIKTKNLFILNEHESIDVFDENLFHGQIENYIQDKKILTEDKDIIKSGRYKEGIIPLNTLKIFEITTQEKTTIIFPSSFPLDKIIGAFIVLDTEIEIQASFKDEYISIKSDIKKINVSNIESEDGFILSGTRIPGKTTTLGDFGYLSLDSYIKNQYGISACTYSCIYSDAIEKKCIHKDKSYWKFFELDTNNITCIHTPEYDSLIEESKRCPGVDARINNPFILTSKISEE